MIPDSFSTPGWNPLLLPCLVDVFLYHFHWVQLCAHQWQIPWRPEVPGKVFSFVVREILEDLCGSVFSDCLYAIRWGCGRWYPQKPLHIFSSDDEIIESPVEGDANLSHPLAQVIAYVTH